MTALRTILVPIDGSPPSIAALDHALALAEDGDVHLDVLRVDAPDTFGVGSTPPSAEAGHREIELAIDEGVQRAHTRLDQRVAFRTVVGDPLSKILEVATDGGYDLIVMGTHGRVGRLHALLGSVTEGVVRSAPCPVLTVRVPGDAYQSFAERRHGRPTLGRPPRHPA